MKVENIGFKDIIPEKEAYENSRLAELSLVVDTQGKYKQLDEVEDIQIEPN